MRASIGLQKADHCFHRGLFGEVLSGLRKQRERGARIHKIAHLDHMLALALRALFSRYTTHIFAHPFGSPPTAPEAQWARGSSVAWAEYTRFSAEASRPFGWTRASET